MLKIIKASVSKFVANEKAILKVPKIWMVISSKIEISKKITDPIERIKIIRKISLLIFSKDKIYLIM